MGIWGKLKNRKEAEEKVQTVASDTSKETTTKERVQPKAKKNEKASATKVIEHIQKVSDYSHRVLVKPLITEKSAHLHGINQYIFAVTPDANKVMVKQAIKEVFGVTPENVRIINQTGKRVRYGRHSGQRSHFKKAIITLPKGQSIKVYEGV